MFDTTLPSSRWFDGAPGWLPLLGEGTEVALRCSGRRSLVDRISAAPVIGLQSYIHGQDRLFESWLQYRCPSSCKSADLPKSTLQHCMQSHKLADRGQYTVYRISSKDGSHSSHLTSLGLASASWIIFAGVMAYVATSKATSWVGIVSCASSVASSIALRLLEANCIESNPPAPPSHPPLEDNGVFITNDSGWIEGCIILLGSAEDIAGVIGPGFTFRKGQAYHRRWLILNLLAVAAWLTFIGTVPFGTPNDQVSFLVFSLVGQAVARIQLMLQCKHFMQSRLTLVERETGLTHPQIIAKLIRLFGDGEWIVKLKVISAHPVWDLWRRRILENPSADAQDVFTQCERETKL